MSSSALGYFYSTSQIPNSAPSTLPRRSRPTNHHYLPTYPYLQAPIQPPFQFQPQLQPPQTASKATSITPPVRQTQNQESQVDEEMLGINTSNDLDSPALSASPPPAPAPRPPPFRNGCQRCRFTASMASANSTLSRSHQHLSGSASNTLTRGNTHNSSLRESSGGGGGGGNHIATSTGHLHTAGTTTGGHHAQNGTYSDKNQRST